MFNATKLCLQKSCCRGAGIVDDNHVFTRAKKEAQSVS
jgi:hypothetical protein